MLIIENLLMALSGLRTNKMRSLLTMLGIIIGIAAVIAIVSIGDSISASFEKSMKEMGIENISVNVQQRTPDGEEEYYGYGVEKKPAESDYLTMAQIGEFRDRFAEEITALSVSREVGAAEMRAGRKNERITLQGTNEEYRTMKKVRVVQGRYIEERDIQRARRAAVIPVSLAEKLRRERGQVIGSEVKLTVEEQIYNYTVIGIYDDSKKTSGPFGDFAAAPSVYIPVTAAGELAGKTNYSSFELTPAFGVNSAELTKNVNAHFEKLYAGNKEWRAAAYNAKADMDSYGQTMRQTKLAIAVIAGISLLVGGIGVMNIMLVSVTERTREIGVRKALGAKDRFIRIQFVVEAIIICAIGGLIGVALGLSISALISSSMGNPIVISMPVILVSVAFSMSIGVFFGYYPANRAAALDPIEALRYE